MGESWHVTPGSLHCLASSLHISMKINNKRISLLQYTRRTWQAIAMSPPPASKLLIGVVLAKLQHVIFAATGRLPPPRAYAHACHSSLPHYTVPPVILSLQPHSGSGLRMIMRPAELTRHNVTTHRSRSPGSATCLSDVAGTVGGRRH